MQAEPRRDLGGAVVECDLAGEHAPHHADHVLDLERRIHQRMAHAAPGAEMHLAVLDVEGGVREQVEIADMVVVHVRHDHVVDLRRVDAEQLQAVAGRAQIFALALPRLLGGEAQVHDPGLACADHRPDEIVERHRHLVRIAAQEILARHPVWRA